MSTVKPPDDPHYKATLSVALHGARLQFHVAQDLFSSVSLDPGTALLLRTLAGVEYSRVLDLGCGYGPLGLFLKAWRPDASVHMVDRDELAVRFSGYNADLNGLRVEAYPSLGYDDVATRDFDLVVSNIPAKAGPRAIESLVLDGAHFLTPGGTMAIVVINRLAGDVRRLIGDPLLEKSNRGYTCFHYRPPAPEAPYTSGFDRGIYDRGRLRYKSADLAAVFGLPEFDTPGFATQLAIKLLPRLKGHVRVLNPGQGLIPALLSGHVSIEDRDLLALRNTARNAELVDGEPDSLVVLLREREARPTVDGANLVLVAGTSTQITRVAEGRDVLERVRTHGFSAAIIKS